MLLPTSFSWMPHAHIRQIASYIALTLPSITPVCVPRVGRLLPLVSRFSIQEASNVG